MCHQGLGFDLMFDCFKYEGFTREETLNKWKVSPSLLNETESSTEHELLGYQNTPFFRMTQVDIKDELKISNNELFSGLYILSGHAEIIAGGSHQLVGKGEQFFIPATVTDFIIRNQGDQACEILRFFGPK